MTIHQADFMEKEKKFIFGRQDSWKRLEELIACKRRSFNEIRELGQLYQQVTEDLSYAQTHFPDTELTDYLNHLVRRCHTVFYRYEGMRLRKVIRFFSREFPEVLYRITVPILLSAMIFLASIGISFFMVRHNTNLGEIFLDQRSFEMAMNDLELRKKFSNFDNIPQEVRSALSLYLWFNNSMVSVYCFVLGITLGLGTAYVLIRNGFMLGALLAIYYMNGHFLDFFSIIMVHGSIELVAIVIAGGAGMNVGLAVLHPGRIPRTERLKENAVSALKVLWGVIALLLMAGLIEGLITTMKLPVPFRLLIAGVNLTLLGLYYARGYLLTRQDRSSLPSA